MRTFSEYMMDKTWDEFEEIYRQAEEAYKKRKYNVAWELMKRARPTTEDQASLQAHFLDALRDKTTEFLIDLKKKTRGLAEVGGSNWGDVGAVKQSPIDPEHLEQSALFSTNLDGDDKPPVPKKFGKDRFRMKKKMKN